VIAESAMADEAMVLATAQPDPLEIALREHSLLVYRISYSVLGDRAEADDATQETFLRALRYGKKFERIENPKAWLARVAWRVAVERRNHQTADAEVETNAHEIASRTTGSLRTQTAAPLPFPPYPPGAPSVPRSSANSR